MSVQASISLTVSPQEEARIDLHDEKRESDRQGKSQHAPQPAAPRVRARHAWRAVELPRHGTLKLGSGHEAV